MRWYPPNRATQAELMDDLSGDVAALERTLTQLELVNALLTRRGTVLGRYLLDHAAKDARRPHRVLDLGAGGGDVALWLARQARRRGLHISITAADHDPRVLAFAQRRCAEEPSITLVQTSATESLGEHDYVICNHFLHHLDERQIPAVLRAVYETGARRFIINDLLRSYASLVGFRLFSAVFLHDSYAREDGLTSIRKGFRPHELATAVQNSPWANHAQIIRFSPGRVCVVADR